MEESGRMPIPPLPSLANEVAQLRDRVARLERWRAEDRAHVEKLVTDLERRVTETVRAGVDAMNVVGGRVQRDVAEISESVRAAVASVQAATREIATQFGHTQRIVAELLAERQKENHS